MTSHFSPFDDWQDELNDRFLAEDDKDDPVRVDYSVLSVGVMTLGLILVVEVLRHRIDHAALGRPFFKSVLEMVYSEFATLGIVEFFLYVISTYHENLDKQKYYVFADIHFALFYTAILNAVQSVLLAAMSTRVSRRIWVQTEMLELNHYVEIREEFDRVKHQLDQCQQPASQRKTDQSGSQESADASHRYDSDDDDDDAWLWNKGSLNKVWKSVVDQIKYPGLQRKYNALLLQVRFHELRVHFLQAYNLPLKLKVSDYLMRREQKVLLKLVHVSSVAWVLLTGAVNVLYYILGIVSYKASDAEVVGTALICVYFLLMGVFVLMAILVDQKMASIFRAIMVEKDLWDVNNVQAEERERLAEQQLALFWGADPKLVIAAIQFMQFGYALTLSVIIIFWKEIDDGSVHMRDYFIVLVVCYAIFLIVTAQAIPRYTLCTSLGQLVDEKSLHETLADYLLETAKQKQLQLQYVKDIDQEIIALAAAEPEEATKTTSTNASTIPLKAAAVSARATAESSSVATSTVPKQLRPVTSQDTFSMIANLVKLDTSTLRSNLPEEERNQLQLRDIGRENRRSRHRTRSEGVGAMAAMGNTLGGMMLFPTTMISTQSKDDAFLASRYEGLNNVNVTGSSPSSPMAPADAAAPNNIGRVRLSRKKSVSDGVALLAQLHRTELEGLSVTPPPTSSDALWFYRAEKAIMAVPQSVPEDHSQANEDPAVVSRMLTSSSSRTLLPDDRDLMAELVKRKTDSLRSLLPEHEQTGRVNRRGRRKTKSEGVGAMAAVGNALGGMMSFPPTMITNDAFLASTHKGLDDVNLIASSPSSTTAPAVAAAPNNARRVRQSRKKSLSDGVTLLARLHRDELEGLSVTPPLTSSDPPRFYRAETPSLVVPPSVAERHSQANEDPAVVSGLLTSSASRTLLPDDGDLMAELVRGKTDALRSLLPEHERTALSLRDMERASKRRMRRKTKSEGVAFMASSMEEGSGSVAADDVFLRTSSRISSGRPSVGSSLPLLPTRSRREGRRKSVSDGAEELTKLHKADLAAAMHQSATGDSTKDGSSKLGWETKNGDVVVELLIGQDKKEELVELPPVVGTKEEKLFATPFLSASKEDEQELVFVEDKSARSATTPAPLSNKVTFCMDTSSAPRAMADDVGAASNLTDDGLSSGHSDIDDVPDVDPSLVLYHDSIRSKQLPPLRDRLLAYFLSRKFVVVSNVFGTMVAFFLAGQRIEGFLHTENIVSPKFVSFDFPTEITFWLLFSYFTIFLCGDALIFYAVKPWNPPMSLLEHKAFIGAALDFALVAMCLILFIVAEVQRCCTPDEDEAARGLDITVRADDSGGYEEGYYGDPAPCDCPTFGWRLYGGLGKLEPYTSFVGLRIFRHWVAKRLVGTWLTRYPSSVHHGAIATSGLNMEPFAVFGDSIRHGHGSSGGDGHSGGRYGVHDHGHGKEEKGTAAELWKDAISNNPELVARYGEFSGELLKAMLGLHVDITELDAASNVKHELLSEDGRSAADSDNEPKPALFALGREYSSLEPGAQEVIMAGKLGRAVKYASTMNLADGIPEHEELRFELDPDAAEGTDLAGFRFTAPNAPLVRSMRRCDRMLLPILNKWTVVDVVLTRFEMVYFDASDVDGPVHDSSVNKTKQALAATKGGKGLRLCDVAAGRRVVGHVELSEIESVIVEREMPVEGNDGDEIEGPERDVEMVEYWMQSHNEVEPGSRAAIWKKIKQDRLKIQMMHGFTLYLRFYSDLEDAEHHPDRLASDSEFEGHIYKSNAFQWVQTIGRFCGPEQLKQSLPHFGDDTSNELRDYLVVHSHTDDGKKGHRRGLSRAITVQNLTELADPRPLLRRAKDSANLLTQNKAPPKRYQRSVSSGDAGGISHFSQKGSLSPSRLTDPANSVTQNKTLPKRYTRSVSLGDAGGSSNSSQRQSLSVALSRKANLPPASFSESSATHRPPRYQRSISASAADIGSSSSQSHSGHHRSPSVEYGGPKWSLTPVRNQRSATTGEAGECESSGLNVSPTQRPPKYQRSIYASEADIGSKSSPRLSGHNRSPSVADVGLKWSLRPLKNQRSATTGDTRLNGHSVRLEHSVRVGEGVDA